MDAQASVEERKEVAEEERQEEAGNAVTLSSTADNAVAAAPADEDEVARQCGAMSRTLERLCSDPHYSEAHRRKLFLVFLSRKPLAWAEHGFSNIDEVNAALQIAEADFEKEGGDKAYQNRKNRLKSSSPPRAKGKGKQDHRGEG